MILLLYITLILFNLFFAYKKRSSKLLTIATFIGIFLLIGGAGPNYDFTSDYHAYEFRYNNLENVSLLGSFEIGYTLLMKLGNALALDFFAFRIIIIVVCFILIYQLLIKKYAANSNYVLLLYLLYPIIIESEHFRNFIAMTLFFIATSFLLENGIKNKIKFSTLLLLSSSIHTVFILYFPLVIANGKCKNNIIYGVALGSSLLFLIMLLNNNQIPYISSIISLIDDGRFLYYLENTTNFGYLIPLTLQLSSIILIYWSKNIVSKDNLEKNYKSIKFVNFVYWINVIEIIYFPLFIINTNFYRLSRNLLLLNFIVYSIASNNIKSSAYKIFFNLFIVISVIMWLIMDLIIRTSSERVLIPFFINNAFN